MTSAKQRQLKKELCPSLMNLVWTPYLGQTFCPSTNPLWTHTCWWGPKPHTLGLSSIRTGERAPFYMHSCLPGCSSLVEPQEWKALSFHWTPSPIKERTLDLWACYPDSPLRLNRELLDTSPSTIKLKWSITYIFLCYIYSSEYITTAHTYS